MPKYDYMCVIKGQTNAKNKTNAYLQVLMGISLTARLSADPHRIAVVIEESKEVNNGKQQRSQSA